MPKRRAAKSEQLVDEPKEKAAAPSASSAIVRLESEFFEQSGVELSKALLGKLLVRKTDDGELTARIVETEAYLGKEDKAAHSYKGKTARNTAMFMSPGTCYVYNVYGTLQCVNISSQGEGCAVLIRSAEPISGIEKMNDLRVTKRKTKTSKPLKTKELCNGPSKLCQALDIKKDLFDQVDLCDNEQLYVADDGFSLSEEQIVVKARIGIAYAQDWTDKPLRFYVAENQFVSVK